MKEEELIHVKLEYYEGFEGKKSVLSSQINLLRLVKIIKTYNSLRQEELSLKIKIEKKLLETSILLNKIRVTLPKIHIPEQLIKHRENKGVDEFESTIRKAKEKFDYGSIESELQEIQQKLRALGT